MYLGLLAYSCCGCVGKKKDQYAWDVDGNRYIDYVGTWGPAICGHANDEVSIYIYVYYGTEIRGRTRSRVMGLVAAVYLDICIET